MTGPLHHHWATARQGGAESGMMRVGRMDRAGFADERIRIGCHRGEDAADCIGRVRPFCD